jgi:hypothetical protein
MLIIRKFPILLIDIEGKPGSRFCFDNSEYFLKEIFLGVNPFQFNFSATRILPSSYLFWAGKRLVDYLYLSYSFKTEKQKQKQKEYNLRYLLAKVRTT